MYVVMRQMPPAGTNIAAMPIGSNHAAMRGRPKNAKVTSAPRAITARIAQSQGSALGGASSQSSRPKAGYPMVMMSRALRSPR